MPAYNHERFVEDAVRGVWAQTYPNVELVVLDDGSRDRTPEILRRLQAASPIPMQVVCKANEGLTRTLNRGLALARGEYIALGSGDDRHLPRHVETLVRAAREEAPGTVVHGDVCMIDGAGARTGRRLSDDFPFRSGSVYEDLLLLKSTLPSIAALVPAALFAEAGGYNEDSLLDDWEMFLKLTRRHPVRYVAEVLAEYRVHGEGQLTRQVSRLLPDRLRIFEENAREYSRGRDARWLRQARSHLYRHVAEGFYIVRDFGEARRWLVRSLAQWPLQPRAAKLLARSLLGARLVSRLSTLRSRLARGRGSVPELNP
jgi:glycosyltransferase involved in cell wall biosynthesis